MNNNYKKIFLTLTLALTAVAAQGASVSSKASVWYDLARNTGTPVDYNGGSITRAQAAEINLDTVVFWKDNEPNDSSSEDCATQVADGTWNDLGCEQSRRVACFNGTNWTISSASVAMGADNNAAENISSAQNACPANTSFSAPVTLAQRNALSSAISAANVTNGVWINAQDMKTENVWAINKNSSAIAPFWGAGEPSGTAGDCAVIDGAGNWSASDCSASYAVACANGTLDNWQIVNSPVAFTSIEKLTQVCQQSFGVFYQFAAPRTSSDNTALRSSLSSAGISSAWINARDNSIEGYWMLNHGLFDWAAGEPDVNRGLCAVARQSDGRWLAADCDSRAKLLCSDGTNWIVRNVDHQFSNQALDACSRPDTDTGTNTFVNYRLRTPVTEPERIRVYQLIRAQGSNINQVWLNLKHIQDTTIWLWNDSYKSPDIGGSKLEKGVFYDVTELVCKYEFPWGTRCRINDLAGPWKRYSDGSDINIAEARKANEAVYSNFAYGEPNNTNGSGCVQLYANGDSAGLWDDDDCGKLKRAACFDGYDWAISPDAVALGANSDTGENITAAHNACAVISKNGIQGNYRFAAPASFDQSMKLLTIAKDSGAGDVWINLNDKRYNGTFTYNKGVDVLAPFWNAGEPNDAGGNEDCAVQQRTGSGLWNDIACSSIQRLACYNPEDGANGAWAITATGNAFTNTMALSFICEQEFGGQYKFYAPVTLSQKADLIAAMGAANVDNAYINANDAESEGTWRLNTEINNWAEGQPSSDFNERCVSVSAESGQWTSRNCNEQLPVACTTGGRWYFTDDPINLSDFANAQQACDSLGEGYLFNAPRTLDSARQIQYFAQLAGVGGDFWINGNRLKNFSAWEWNQRQLNTPVWSSSEPDGGSQANCAILQNDTEASWADEYCDSATDRAYLCRNGSSWQVSAIQGSLEDFSQAVAACAALGNGWEFAAPATYNDNLAAKNAMGAESQVWINATDAMREGSWVLNAAAIHQYPNWAAGEPDNGGIAATDLSNKGQDCVYQADNGQWSDIGCSSANEYAWACTDGYVWKVTKGLGRIQSLADGHKQCFNEYGATFVFAAPLNKNDAIQIDFARLQAEKERLSAIPRVWLNMTDGGDEDIGAAGDGSLFRKNLPFVNWFNLSPGEEPKNLCVYKSTVSAGQNSPWYTTNCTTSAAHYACFDGASWKIATSKGALLDGSLQVVPQVGEDYWSYERGDRMCKDQFGQQYYFSAPVTAAEELALDATIRSSNAHVKDTWLNYYYVSEITSNNNRWFANRLKLGIWQKPVFDNYNNSDCALVDASGSWTDVPCTETHSYACFDGAWNITGQSGKWSDGFAACENSKPGRMFAVPRTPDEMNSLISLISGGNKVWVNLSDTGLESQWISNRLRYAWWGGNEPSNNGNRDCAQMNTAGEWYAAKCFTEVAPFACRKVNGSNIEWYLTTAEGIWSQGFSACALEYPDSEFISPNGYGNHSATMDQNTLTAIVGAAGKSVWLNLSDQEVEGSWRPYQVYGDWAVDSLLDNNNDCGYFDRVTAGRGTWYADNCKYVSGSAVSRGFSCTDGYEWRVVDSAPTTNLRWSEGFTACQTLGVGWRFAAPTNAIDNAKLKLALELAGLEQVWINAHDRMEEGEWQINGAETNFAVFIDLSQTAQLVNEKVDNIQLHALLADDEEIGVAAASWELISNADFDNPANTHTDITVGASTLTAGINGTATVIANYSTPALLQKDRILTFKVTATDIPPGTASPAVAEALVSIRVKAPVLAHYNFENSSSPQNDISGNDHHALNTADFPMPGVSNGALVLADTQSMVIPGLAADSVNGLVLPDVAYTIAFRISIESAVAGGILQKGDDGFDRQPALFMYPDAASLHTTNSTTADNNRAANVADIPFQQWLNVIYVKDALGFRVYLDEELAASYDYVGGETALGNTGNLYVGKVPGHTSSFSGFIDDLQIYNRALNAAERGSILPAPPVGQVQFVGTAVLADEFTAAPGNTVTVVLERIRGSKAPLTVYIDTDSVNSTATQGALTDMAVAANAADFALPASYVPGTGLAVNWPADTRGQQSFVVTLDNADDNLREGTEIARLKINDAGGASIGAPASFAVRLTDLTENPYGNFSLVGPDPQIVLDTDSSVQSFCILRESGSDGEVTVNYEVSGNAVAGVDYQYVAGEITPAGNSGSVIFADGDNADKCINLQVAVNPEVGTADKSLSVTLTGLTYTAPTDPILAQNHAALIIRDYAPGELAFSSGSFSCKEPNTSATVPDELKPSVAELTCEIVVTRTNTSIYAPAAAVTVTATPASPSDYSFTAQLNWPEITPSEPANASTENQSITFAIVNDDVQENNEVASLLLTPVGSENIVEDNATLTIVDVTSPALVSLSSAVASVDEGGNVVFNILRSGNLNTVFSFDYELGIEGKPAGKPDSDYVDFVAGAAQTGTISYSIDDANDARQLMFKSIDTLEPTASIGLRLMLKNPTTPRTVGMGALGKANSDNGTNKTDVLVNVLNTKDLIENNYSIKLSNGGDTVYEPGVTPAVPSYLTTNTEHSPTRRVVNFSFTLPAKNTLDIDHTKIRYTWRVLENSWFDGVATQTDSDGLFTARLGNVDYGIAAQDPSAPLTVSGSFVVPFVIANTDFTLELKLEGGDGSTYPEVFTKQLTFTAVPLWRELLLNNNSSECLQGASLSSCGGDGSRWTWNPDNRRLINKARVVANRTDYCFKLDKTAGSDELYLENCNMSDVEQSATFPTDGSFDEFNIDNEAICGYLGGSGLNANGGGGACVAADRRWNWRN